VDLLVQAGASLSGFDIESAFAKLATKTALHSGGQAVLRIWSKAGVQVSSSKDSIG
jgi:hypothetical protein